MKKLKQLTAVIAAAIIGVSVTACGGNNDEVIAKVNDAMIYQSDYDALYDEYINYFGGGEEAEAYLSEQKALLLEELVANEVMFQKAEELNITCTDEEIEEAYQTIETQYGEDTVAQMLEYSNMTLEDYKKMLKDQLILSELQEHMIEGDTTVTDEEAKKYYDEHQAEYTVGAGANMKHILVKVPADADEITKDKAEAAVKTIEEALANGTTFEALYEKYSKEDEEDTLYVTEDLGFVQYEEPNFDPDFLAGVKDIKEGAVSEPIKSSFGNHFVKVTGIAEETLQPYDTVKESIKETLKSEKEYALYDACLTKWIEEANIETYEDRIK